MRKTAAVIAMVVGFSGSLYLTFFGRTSEIEGHLRKACELVWSGAEVRVKVKVDRCTTRAMAAMGNDSQLYNNELKRLLIASERELRACKDKVE